MFREIAGHRPGVITKIGLKTFIDPRLEGGKMNERTKEDLVELIEMDGEEWLRYKSFPVNVALIRATYCDEEGNATMDKKQSTLDSLAIAQAAKNSGGIVLLQVEKVVQNGTLDARKVKIPGIYVDGIVVSRPENHWQTYEAQYNPALCGEVKVPVDSIPPMPLNQRKVICRRAAMELDPHAIINLGIGMPEGVASVAAEEGLESMVLTTGGGCRRRRPGRRHGFWRRHQCGLHSGAAGSIRRFMTGADWIRHFSAWSQMDGDGNVNVSKFGPKIAGCGGFINITQNAKKVVYCGTFTAGGLDGLEPQRYAEAPPGGQGQKAGQAGGAGDLCGPLRNQA